MPAGWYHADGDPAGTQRYWDGETWQGGPQTIGAGISGDVTTVNGMNISGEWKRIGGRVIDAIISGAISLVLTVIGLGATTGFDFTSDGGDDTNWLFVGGLAIVGVIFALLWDALFVAFLGGTPGKLMLGMRVVDAETGTTPPGPQFGFKRALNRLLGLFPAIGGAIAAVIGIVSLVFLFTDDQKRTVMDRIAGTVVVDVK